MPKIVILFFALIAIQTCPVMADEINVADGIWFRCEFAHSQIPPEDDCRMLDDDGFQVINGIVHHVKVNNSEETRCRHERVGNCFLHGQKGLVAERSEIGPIELSTAAATVSWLGCSQKYRISKLPNYLDIVPDGELCWWTPNKHYFVARFRGPLKIIAEE